jgi:hypothetical protein
MIARIVETTAHSVPFVLAGFLVHCIEITTVRATLVSYAFCVRQTGATAIPDAEICTAPGVAKLRFDMRIALFPIAHWAWIGAVATIAKAAVAVLILGAW